MKLINTDLTRDEFSDALAYLEDCRIFLPDFPHRICATWGNSLVTSYADGRVNLRLGCYPTRGSTKWFVMHEIGHVLCHFYRPTRDRRFAATFGSPQPDDYDKISWLERGLTDIARPDGFPSRYSQSGGGEEHFVELMALMYVDDRGFAGTPPTDLAATWSVAWNRGLKHMTKENLPRPRRA